MEEGGERCENAGTACYIYCVKKNFKKPEITQPEPSCMNNSGHCHYDSVTYKSNMQTVKKPFFMSKSSIPT